MPKFGSRSALKAIPTAAAPHSTFGARIGGLPFGQQKASLPRTGARVHPEAMTVSPLPRDGATLSGRDRKGRTLRIARHVATSRVVLSVWQDSACLATVRLAPEDVAELVAQLTRTLLPSDDGQAEAMIN